MEKSVSMPAGLQYTWHICCAFLVLDCVCLISQTCNKPAWRVSMVWGQIPHDQQRCSPELSALCPCQSLSWMCFMGQKSQQLLSTGVYCYAGSGVHVNSVVVPPAPWARGEGGRRLQGLGDSDPGGGLGGKLQSWGPLAAANPITAQAWCTRQSCFTQCQSQDLPCAPEESCCHLSWACSSWGKAFVQMKTQLQELSFNPYSLCLEQALQMSSGVCWRLLGSI